MAAAQREEKMLSEIIEDYIGVEIEGYLLTYSMVKFTKGFVLWEGVVNKRYSEVVINLWNGNFTCFKDEGGDDLVIAFCCNIASYLPFYRWRMN